MRVKSKARTGNTVPESASGSSTAPDFRVANPVCAAPDVDREVCAAPVAEAESKLLDVLGRTGRRKLDPNLSYGRDVIYFDV